MPASAPSNAAAVRLLSTAGFLDRASAGSLCGLAPGFVRQRPVLRASRYYGSYDAHLAEDDSDDTGQRSDAGQDDDDDACCFHSHVSECVQRLEPLFLVQ